MRKILTTILLAMFFIPVVNAQLTKIGGGIGYNYDYYFNNETVLSDHKLKNPLFSFTGIYEINLPFHLSPSINIYFPNIDKFSDAFYSTKHILTGYSVDIDAHYVFNSLDRFELYGLTGVNILYVRSKYVDKDLVSGQSFKSTGSETAFGANLGIGSYIKMKEQFDLFVELKAILAKQVQFVGNVGILLNIDWLKKNEEQAF